MWRNYLTVGLRSLMRSKAYTAINVFGLAVGMASCILILVFVRHELSYDKWLPNAERTFQVQAERVATEEPPSFLQTSFYPAASLMERDFPQIERTAATWRTRPVVLVDRQPVYVDMLLADPDLFEVLELEFVRGDRRTALRDPDSLVLTETEARRFFGSSDPIGRVLPVGRQGETVNLRVTGVLRDLPENSHLALTMVGRLHPGAFPTEPEALAAWNRMPGYVYARLRPGADAAAINAALPAWEQRVIPRSSTGSGEMSRADRWALRLTNVRDVHLGAFQENAMTRGGDMRTIVTFSIVALLILAVACVNFANLTTARASERTREVALRKVLGARRGQLIAQFIGEAVLLAGMAAIVALAAVELALPAVASLVDAPLELSYFGDGGMLMWVVLLTLIVGAVGGSYPAFYLSGFRPSAILRAGRFGAGTGGGRLRTALVVGQFAVSIGLMICTAIVYAQTLHARSADAGYRRDGLLVVDNLSRAQVQPLAETLVREVARLDGVRAVGRSEISPAEEGRSTTHVELPGRAEPVAVGAYVVDPGFLQAMEIHTVAGRAFSADQALDDATVAEEAEWDSLAGRGINVVVSEAGARQLGFRAPAAALGQTLRIETVPATIVGVVADVQYRSARDEMEPILYIMSRTEHDSMVIRYEGVSPQALLEQVRGVWGRLVPDVPFEGSFAEDLVAELYRSEEGRGQLFALFAGLAIVIGSLGLYALAAFAAERRTKEIGIRKILGARTADIVRLLVWQFLRPVVIANLIAWPVAWWAMTDWLNGFSERIDLNPAWFLAAGIVALAIATGTIIGHAVRVARANPIHALRYE
ncbi:MAG TPA: ABC transporter permease [Allosphingosinicella sp.]|nr:ABC transporter permease [Allosphingosinicella sp.]